MLQEAFGICCRQQLVDIKQREIGGERYGQQQISSDRMAEDTGFDVIRDYDVIEVAGDFQVVGPERGADTGPEYILS